MRGTSAAIGSTNQTRPLPSTDGIESAVLQAKKAVGDKNVAIATATTMRQCLKAGLLDEITIDLIPVLLGSGVRLFERIGIEPVELEIIKAVEAPGVTHLRYRVVKRDQES